MCVEGSKMREIKKRDGKGSRAKKVYKEAKRGAKIWSILHGSVTFTCRAERGGASLQTLF